MDTVSKAVRSSIMSKIKSGNNKTTEWRLRAKLVRSGVKGWRVRPRMRHSPDFAFDSPKVVVFVDGCFWHLCPLCGRIPKSNREYWLPKLARNAERDALATRDLESAGWIVLRFWEHDLRDDLDRCLSVIKAVIKRAPFV